MGRVEQLSVSETTHCAALGVGLQDALSKTHLVHPLANGTRDVGPSCSQSILRYDRLIYGPDYRIVNGQGEREAAWVIANHEGWAGREVEPPGHSLEVNDRSPGLHGQT